MANTNLERPAWIYLANFLNGIGILAAIAVFIMLIKITIDYFIA